MKVVIIISIVLLLGTAGGGVYLLFKTDTVKGSSELSAENFIK